MNNEKLTREQLYDLVWTTPLSTLSRKYAFSDNGIRKICKKMDIPLPPVGYWQKLQYGKKVNKPKLKVNTEVDQEVSLPIRSKDSESVNYDQTPLAILKNEIAEKYGEQLKVPEKLSKPDEIIIEAKRILNENAKSRFRDNGLVRSFDGIKIKVTPENIARSLRFMDTFIKMMKQRGHQVKVYHYKTVVEVFGGEYEINLREKLKVVPNTTDRYSSRDLIPTGILCFQFEGYHGREWKDNKKAILEDQLANIIAKIEIVAKESQKEKIRHAEEERIRKEKMEIERQLQLRKSEELNKFKELLNQANRVQQVSVLRNYIEQTASSKDLTEEKSEWIKWAKQKADWFDPFINTHDEFLDDFNKDEIVKSQLKNEEMMENYFKKSGWW